MSLPIWVPWYFSPPCHLSSLHAISITSVPIPRRVIPSTSSNFLLHTSPSLLWLGRVAPPPVTISLSLLLFFLWVWHESTSEYFYKEYNPISPFHGIFKLGKKLIWKKRKIFLNLKKISTEYSNDIFKIFSNVFIFDLKK